MGGDYKIKLQGKQLIWTKKLSSKDCSDFIFTPLSE